jgi:uncharacterized protein (TIGR02300 family)
VKTSASAAVWNQSGERFDSARPAWQGSALLKNQRLKGSPPLASPDLGTKQICPHCQAKFYDLNKRPAHCPKCATEFDPDEAVRNRRVRARAVVPETEADDERADQVRGGEAENEEEEEEATAPALDEVADEPMVDDDDDEEGAEPGAGSGDDLGEFSDDEDVEESDDVPFLEEDEDDFDDSEIDGLPEDGEDE